MLDLTKPQKGRFGDEVFFSDLFGRAIVTGFTGGFFIKTADAHAEVYFRKGAPIHARGTLFTADRLGEVLMAQGAAADDVITAALERQTREKDRPVPPLLGALLAEAHAVELPVVSMALKAQLSGRVQKLFTLTFGSWHSEFGTFGPIDRVATAHDGVALLASALHTSSSDKELTLFNDALLGQAVKSLATPAQHESLSAASESMARALHLLDRPRKPEHVERHTKDRRSVRAILKALKTLEVLELLPGSEGRPIIDRKTAEEAVARSQAQTGTRAASEIKGVAPSAARAASKKESPLALEIRALIDTVYTQNHFELFDYEVGEAVDAAELRKRFSALAKKYHPDTVGRSEGEEIQRLARDLLSKYNDAYATLTDEKKRVEYQAALLKGEVPADESQKAKAAVAKTKFDMAVVMLKKKDYKKARELLKMATTMDPQQGLYKCYYGWAFHSDPSLERAVADPKARELIKAGIEQSPKHAQAQYFWGVVLKQDGKLSEAKKAFTIASKMDSKLTDAERELRLMEMRSGKADDGGEKKGVLSRLFKRGKD